MHNHHPLQLERRSLGRSLRVLALSGIVLAATGLLFAIFALQ